MGDRTPPLPVLASPLRAGLSRFRSHFQDADLEREFRRDYEADEIPKAARTTYGMSAAMLSVFAIVDWLVLTDAGRWPLVIRFGFLVPIYVVLLILSLFRFYGRVHGVLAIVALLSAMGAVAGIGVSSSSPGKELYLASASALMLFLPAARVPVGSAAIAALLGPALLVAIARLGSQSWTLQLFVALNTISVGVGAIVGARVVAAAARQNFLQRRLIEAGRHRSEQLLLNVLPRSIAERLKEGGAIADRIDEVTVLFADIVGFTPMAARLSPDQLVARLGEIFSEFDRLADECGIEKIKTIGDAYMAVAGAPAPSSSGVDQMADMALQMLERVEAVSRRFGEVLDVRIGIHTGPAIAGVLGTRKFAYDLWGETVNLASRMEHHGIAGRIQVTDATRQRLGDRFTFEDRGEIEVKGAGVVHTWFLLGRSKS